MAVSVAPFVGRTAELDQLRAALELTASGQTRCVLLSGTPGMGKTRLAEVADRTATERGCAVVWGRCHEGEGAPAFWPWVQVARHGLRLRAAKADIPVPDVLTRLAKGEPLPFVPDSSTGLGSGARFQLFDAIGRLLEEVAQTAPLVVILDDLHGADQPSLSLLQFLLRELRTAPLLILGSFRQAALQSGHPFAATFAELLRAPTTQHIALTTLSQDDIAQLVQERLPAAPSQELARLIHERTEGLPLYVSEFVRLLEQQLRPGRSFDEGLLRSGIPGSLAAIIQGRLSTLSEATQRVLAAASVLGREFDRQVLEQMAGASASEAAVHEALTAEILSESPTGLDLYRFSHALLSETLYAGLSPHRRMELHHAAGVAIEALPQAERQASELAHHFYAAGTLDGLRSAARYAKAAADRAMAGVAYEEAERLYRLSLEALDRVNDGDVVDRCEVLLLLGRVQNVVSNYVESGDSFRRLATLGRSLLATDAAAGATYLASAALGLSGDTGGAIEMTDFRGPQAALANPELANLFDEAMTALGPGDHVLKAKLLARRAVDSVHALPAAELDAMTRAAVEMAQRLGDSQTLAYVMVLRFIATWGPDDLEARLQLAADILDVARRSGDQFLIATGHAWRLLLFLESGRLDEYKRENDLFRRIATQSRQPFLLWSATIHEASQALWLGSFAAAEGLIRAAFRHGRRGRTAAEGYASLQWVALHREQDKLDMQAGLIEFLKAAADVYPAIPSLRAQLAFLLAETGKLEAARAEWAQLLAVGFDRFPRVVSWLATMTECSEVCRTLGDADSARRLYDLLLPFAERYCVGLGGTLCWGSVARSLGVLATVMQCWDEADAHFTAALAANQRLGSPLWIAHTQYDHALMLLQRAAAGDDEAGIDLLRRALDGAARIGMSALEGRARRRLEEVETVPPPREVVPPAGGEAIRAASALGVFRCEGAYWTVIFAERVARLRDSKGMHYLRQLLSNPGVEMHALELAGMLSGDSDSPPENFASQGDIGPPLDDVARSAYRERLVELREEIEEAQRFNDVGRRDRAQQEIEALTQQLSTAFGLGGRARRTGAHAERARFAVTKRVRDAIKRIGEQHPLLAQHLSSSIKTGVFCVYQPDPLSRVPWSFSTDA